MDDLRRLIPKSLAERGRRLRELTETVHTIVPREFIPHCEVIGLNDGILTLAVESAIWRTRLRFVEDDLLRLWPRSSSRPRKIKVKVVDLSAARPRPRSAQRISPDTAEQMQSVARRIEHPRLAAALQRLARRGLD